jgi:parvulin-like peptidyl-prolyl isomerase
MSSTVSSSPQFTSHILLTTEDEAKDVKTTQQENDFSELARKIQGSINRKMERSGVLSRDQMVKPFSDKAFSMKPNQISDRSRPSLDIILLKSWRSSQPKI